MRTLRMLPTLGLAAGLALLLNSGYLVARAEPTLFYLANVVFIEDNPWIAIFPGLAIFITVLGFNMFGDGLRDALDPRLKQ